MKKIGIIGSRRRDSESGHRKILEQVAKLYEEGDRIISGGCPKGGDRFAEMIARSLGCSILIFYPNWDDHGRGAGFVRNTYIADESDILIACVAEDRKGGTEDTIKKFLKNKSENNLYLV